MNNIPKSLWIAAALTLVVVGVLVAKVYKVSLVDMVADRVIQKLNAGYHPYGPGQLPAVEKEN